MSFLAPYYVWGLLGLLIPVGIHLWSRYTPRVIRFGSIRLLENAEASSSMSWHLTERGLLALRMVLIALLCFLLAQPVWHFEEPEKRHWILLEPTLTNLPAVQQLLDTTQEEVRYLRPRFPSDRPVGDSIPFSYWDLIQEAAWKQADSITVVASSQIKFFKGKRPFLGKPVHWITLDPSIEPQQEEILTYKGASGEPHSVKVFSSQENMRIERTAVSGVKEVDATDTLRVIIYQVGDPSASGILFQSAFEAIGSYLDIPVKISMSSEPQVQGSHEWMVWLGESDSLPVDNRNKLFYLVKRQPGPAILPTHEKDVYMINGDLTNNDIYQRQIMTFLVNAVDPLGLRERNLLEENDLRLLTFGEAPESAESFAYTGRSESAAWPFWILLVVIVIFERIWSVRR